jgi:hypothetical protein
LSDTDKCIAAGTHIATQRHAKADCPTLTHYRDKFTTPYGQHASREGDHFTLVSVIDTPDAEHDAEVLPMYLIEFEDGERIEAWPEEVVRYCHCGAPAQGPPSDYPDVCTQWPLCEKENGR